MRRIIFIATLIVAANAAQAETFPVISDQIVVKECGECHMAYPPETMTRSVWRKIIGDLSNHFGEDASLDAASVQHILAYHEANASDVSDSRAAMKWTSDVLFSRLTEGPRFIEKHGNCAPEIWTDPKVKSKSNCQACHKTMQTDGNTDADISFLSKDQQALCNELGSLGVFLNGLF